MPTTPIRTTAQSVFWAKLPNDSVAQPKIAVGVRRAAAATTDSGIDCAPVGATVTRHSRSRNNTSNAASAPARPSDEARFRKAREDEAGTDMGLFLRSRETEHQRQRSGTHRTIARPHRRRVPLLIYTVPRRRRIIPRKVGSRRQVILRPVTYDSQPMTRSPTLRARPGPTTSAFSTRA